MERKYLVQALQRAARAALGAPREGQQEAQRLGVAGGRGGVQARVAAVGAGRWQGWAEGAGQREWQCLEAGAGRIVLTKTAALLLVGPRAVSARLVRLKLIATFKQNE